MNCEMEEFNRLCVVLSALGNGYSTGDFNEFFPFLSDDCVLESQWVLTPNVGYKAVTSYFTKKGKTLIKTDNFPFCSCVELLENYNPKKKVRVKLNDNDTKIDTCSLLYTPGKPCLEMRQTVNGKEIVVLIDVSLNQDGMVNRIDLCTPEFFKYRIFLNPTLIYPSVNNFDNDHENKKHVVRLNEPYSFVIDLLLCCLPDKFADSETVHMPMKAWNDLLKKWEEFASYSSYDEAFEALAGINYNTGTVSNPDVAEQMGIVGKEIWEDRVNSNLVLTRMKEWTDLYNNSYSYMNIAFTW